MDFFFLNFKLNFRPFRVFRKIFIALSIAAPAAKNEAYISIVIVREHERTRKNKFMILMIFKK